MEEDDTGVKADSSSYTGDDNTCDFNGEVDDYSSWDDSYNAPMTIAAVSAVEENATAVVVAEVAAGIGEAGTVIAGVVFAPEVIAAAGAGLAAYGAYSCINLQRTLLVFPRKEKFPKWMMLHL